MHAYCCAAMPEKCKHSTDSVFSAQYRGKIDDCESYLSKLISQRKEDASELYSPLFISEFGSCDGSEKCLKEIEYVTT